MKTSGIIKTVFISPVKICKVYLCVVVSSGHLRLF